MAQGGSKGTGSVKLLMVGVVALTLPGLVIRFMGIHPPPPLAALVFGFAIVGAAFLLSWATEVAQLDIAAGLALAVLAFVAVLPEYAVDLVFAWRAGTDPSQAPLALANMTGANRLLIGIGWSLVVLLAVRASKKAGQPTREVHMGRTHSIEIVFLAIATLYSLTLPLKTTLTLIDAVPLVLLFVAYLFRVSRLPSEEPELIGPAAYIGEFAVGTRRSMVGVLFVFPALVILACAEPFAEALVETGTSLGISEFLLVQWLAPLASEAPELIVASLFALRLKATEGLGALVSSKVNQWTLLVGTLPIVYAISSGGVSGLPLNPEQRGEILLTAAQSAFAVAILFNLSMDVREALALLGLFLLQFVIGGLAQLGVLPTVVGTVTTYGISVVYLALAVWLLVRHWSATKERVREGLRTPPQELHEADQQAAADEPSPAGQPS